MLVITNPFADGAGNMHEPKRNNGDRRFLALRESYRTARH
jgi:hypothetical protein